MSLIEMKKIMCLFLIAISIVDSYEDNQTPHIVGVNIVY